MFEGRDHYTLFCVMKQLVTEQLISWLGTVYVYISDLFLLFHTVASNAR